MALAFFGYASADGYLMKVSQTNSAGQWLNGNQRLVIAGNRTHNPAMQKTWLQMLANDPDEPLSLKKWLVIYCLLTAVGLFFAVVFLLSALSDNQPGQWLSAIVSALLPLQLWAATYPLIVWLDRRIRARYDRWPQIIALLYLVGIALAFANTVVSGLLQWLLIGAEGRSLSEFFQSIWVGRTVMGVIAYKAIVTTDYLLGFYDGFRAERDRTARLEAQLAQAELRALKMQLQPHFLFNALNSISSLVLQDGRAAVDMITYLGDFLRLTIENNGAKEVDLERELEFLRCYLEIEQVRFRDRLAVNFEIEPEARQAQVPNLILQPIIENAIKHGIAPRSEAGHIEISARRLNGHLQIRVCDDGSGLDMSNAGAGVGLANTRERLRHIYRDDFQLSLVRGERGGTIVILEIPFEKAAEKRGEKLP